MTESQTSDRYTSRAPHRNRRVSATGVTGSARGRRRRIPQMRRRLIIAYILIFPVVVWRAAVALYPFINTIVLSFQRANPLEGPNRWIGVHNYVSAFTDPTVLSSLSFTAIFSIVSTLLQLVVGLLLAIALNKRFRGRALLRSFVVLTWATPVIVVATAGIWLLDPDLGIINGVLGHLFGIHPLWLSQPNLARIAVIALDVWQSAPWAAIIILAGLQNIPNELYEAAAIDGAPTFRIYWSVVLPILSPVIISSAIFVVSQRILVFDLVYGLTNGGPSGATSILSYSVYDTSFTGLQFGYGATIATITFLCVVVACVPLYFAHRRFRID